MAAPCRLQTSGVSKKDCDNIFANGDDKDNSVDDDDDDGDADD